MVTLRSKVRFARMHHTSLGFTLVELLVVIAIIALLLAILMPVLGAARESGRSIVCSQRLRQQHLAHVMYAQENKDWFFQSWLWFREMIAYKRQKGDMSYALLKCPTSLGFGLRGPQNNYLGYWSSGYDWADPPFVDGGHGFNAIMNGIHLGSGCPGAKITGHKFPDKTAVAIDASNPYWNVYSGGNPNPEVAYRHKKRNVAYVVYLDGHTVGEKKGKVWTAKDLYYAYP